MKKVSVYTRGFTHAASYYRILQYTEKIKCAKIVNRFTVTEKIFKKYTKSHNLFWKIIFHLTIFYKNYVNFCKDLIYKPDIVIVSRATLPKVCVFPLNLMYKKILKHSYVVWDFDDNIFNINEITDSEARILEKYSDKIIVTGDHLITCLPADVHSKVEILPTTDGDLTVESYDEINSLRKRTFDNEINIIWVASSSGLKHINMIGPTLDKTAKVMKEKLGKDLKLTVICDQPFEYRAKYININNIVWGRDIVLNEMLKAHIGIMPLQNTERSKGKGGFKIIQYMAVGLPAIASDVGYNKNVIVDGNTGFLVDDKNDVDNWINAIIEISSNYKSWEKLSIESLNQWNEKFSYNKNYTCWYNLLYSINKK